MAGVPSVTVSALKEDRESSAECVEQVPSTVTAAGASAQEGEKEPAPSEDGPAAILEPCTTEGDGMARMLGAHTPVARGAAPAMSLLIMEEKFSSGQYRAIGDFVSDFRTMLEGCYQLHGADHWLSRQAQKLELMLEQKLSLLSRNPRDKASAALTSKSCDKPEEDVKFTSTRRRSSARNLANINSGAMESVMVQVLKQAEFLRAKEEKRIKEQVKKEAEEANQKEMEEWDRGLLALAAPSIMETMWEIPAIGHFLCLAQQVLNLPEIVFYELERCLLMPQCNIFLAKIMTSLLSPPHRRPTLHRRPNLTYRAWEAALKQKVQQWYTVIGQAENHDRCAEKLGLCSQFFKVLGEVNPLEQRPFHELTFYQKVWLLKGLCDFVYETQSEVQDAVLGQPIHECREVILGYDVQENAYIHFPQFCGADVRVYKQRPFKAPEFPVPSIKIKRSPRAKSSRSKYSKKRNGIYKTVKKVASSTYSTHPEEYCDFKEESSANCQVDNCNSFSDNDTRQDCGHEDHSSHDFNMTVCKENVEKSISPGELVGYGEPLSPGEIRILENVDKYTDSNLLKADTSPLKENALKTYQVHMNGNHTHNTDIICRRVAMDIILDHPLLNHKKLKLSKVRPKKKKKKKKIKDLLNENIQGKCENLQTNIFRSLKAEIHNKFYVNKKQAKHKKHKSGKKPVCKKTVIKKRKMSAASPAFPEFQLVCTNLDELRELIKKIDGELKCMDNNKKKSGKWHFRRQGVKELHSTLTRLLNELLPWEPKLLKAFQKNRARLRRDYDDFVKLTNSENLTRESCNRECGTIRSSNPSKTFVPCQSETPEKDFPEKLVESELGKSNIARQNIHSKELPGRSCKRLSRQCSYTENEEKDNFSQKRIKLSTHEVSSSSSEGRAYVKCLEDQKQIDPDVAEIRADVMFASPLDVFKGTKPIQALLAKNLGNKVTLSSNLAQSGNKPVSQHAEDVVPLQPALPCQTALKTPLQMIYKLNDGHRVPVLQNSPVKIQVQPVLDTKTGDKLMQQVLLLPKNLFIPQRDEKLSKEDNHHTQTDVAGEMLVSNVSPPVSSVGYITTEKTAQLVTDFIKSTVHSTTCSTPVVSQQPITTLACSTTLSPCETSKNSTPNLTVMPSAMSTQVHSDFGGVISNTGSTVMGSHIVNVSGAPHTDLYEAKQELKTVCIRDSQSILVRTRGGNTGLVKVQPSQEQVTPVSNSVFTFTPQLQSYLVSKSKTSVSPKFTPVSQSSGLQTSTISGDRNSLTEINTKSSQVHYPSARICTSTEKSMQSSNLISTAHLGHWPTVSQAATTIGANTVNIRSCNSSEHCGITLNKHKDIKITESSISVVQPDTTTPSKGDLLSGSSLHKLLLITPPPILPSTNTPKISMLTTSAITPQKFVFINTQVPASSSSTNVALQTSKSTSPTIFGKTYVKPAESPQIILIPSTITSPIKTSSASIVSQVKDVKIGLTIGQTIVNSTSGAKNILPINILQNTLGKKDENTHKDFTVPNVENFNVKGQNEQITSSNFVCTVPRTKASTTCTVMATTKPVSNQSSGSDLLKTLPPFSKSFSHSNVGSTVALSTVKTGHLSSSLLLSTTQMPGHAKYTLSSLQVPVTTTCLGESSRLKTSMAGACQPVTKDLVQNSQHVSEKLPKMLNANAAKIQVTATSPLIPSLCKSGSVDSPYQALPPFTSTTVTQLMPQLNDSCTHQKLVINTSTPLAPGTQITINGTRLIVPPQGLGAGNHVLLLSSNTKQGHSLVGSTVQTCHSSLLNNTTVQQPSLRQSIEPIQTSGQPFKNMYSVATSKMLPFVQNATQYVNMTSKLLCPCPVSSVERVSSCPSLPTVSQPQIAPCIPQGSYSQPSNVVQLPKSIPVKEQVNLSVGNSSTNLVTTSVVPENNLADSALLVYQSSAPEKQHTVAS